MPHFQKYPKIPRNAPEIPEIPRNAQKYPFLMGVLDRKAPQQLAGKTVGIKISIFGNSSWPLTARNGPKRAVLGPFWGIAGRLRLARKFITFFYCRAIKIFLRCLQSPNRRCLPRGGLRSAFPSSNPAFSPEKKCLTSGFYGTRGLRSLKRGAEKFSVCCCWLCCS